MGTSKRYVGWFVLLMVLISTGCHRANKPVPESMLTGAATIAADEALAPLINAELDVFQNIYKYSSIECKYVSEYDAVNLILQEKIRLAIVGRPLSEKENEFLKSKEIVPESIPLAYDAIALIVNPENKCQTMSLVQIGQILSGEITDWNQISNSGKSGNLQLIFDSESSGVIRYLNEKLKLNKKLSGDIKFAGSSKNVFEMVAENPNGIGFVGFNWMSEAENTNVQLMLKKVNLIAVSNASTAADANSFIPSVGSIYNNTYPLIRRVYAIYTDPSASLARGFLAHLTSERGQKIIYRMGLKPESDFQRLVNIKKDF